MRGDQMGGQEPGPERQVGSVHHGAGDDGNLLPAGLEFAVLGRLLSAALPDPGLRPELPPAAAAAVRTHEAVRPPLLGQVGCARPVVGEGRRELLERRRAVVFPASHHPPPASTATGEAATSTARDG
jgi:hypothetical protein